MKKRFGIYVLIWAVLLALFNVIAFVSPGWIWFEKYGASFWVGYAFITVTFFGQLACAWFALREERASKLFYKVSLIATSYTGLIVTFVVGGLCMLISPLPYWVGAIVCSVVFAANVVAIVKAAVAVDEVQKIDDKVKVRTGFIRKLTLDAEALVANAKDAAVKAECKKVYEVIRYSDPMSDSELADIENKIAEKFAKFADAVKSDSTKVVCELSAELFVLVSERNNECKLLKET